MEKKNIKKYAATGLLAATLLTGVGLGIHDTHVDHTEEVCLITRIMNVIPNDSYSDLGTYLPTGVALHQWPEMENDYAEKGIEDVQITYGKIIEEPQTIMPIDIKAENGEIYAVAPYGYYLTYNENGHLVCQRNTVYTQDTSYGLKSAWGELSYDTTNGFSVSHEYEDVLRIK